MFRVTVLRGILDRLIYNNSYSTIDEDITDRNVGARHPAHSSLRKESPAELMLLTLVWDETASGTGRSKTGNELHSLSLLLVFVWDKTASGTARSKTGNGVHS